MSRPIGRLQAATLRTVILVGLAIALAGCEALVGQTPKPTRAGFQGIAIELAKRGVEIDSMVSGDAGCDDEDLAPTAVSLRAGGLDQPGVVTLYVHGFRNEDSYQRLRPAIDACARSYVSDPETFEAVDAAPYVVTGQGPWGPRFEAAIREALDEATPDR
jgi:hypothetical protein